jgi:hypothetical protein
MRPQSSAAMPASNPATVRAQAHAPDHSVMGYGTRVDNHHTGTLGSREGGTPSHNSGSTPFFGNYQVNPSPLEHPATSYPNAGPYAGAGWSQTMQSTDVTGSDRVHATPPIPPTDLERVQGPRGRARRSRKRQHVEIKTEPTTDDELDLSMVKPYGKSSLSYMHKRG